MADELSMALSLMSQTVSTGNSHIPDPYAVYADSFDLSLLPSSNLSLSSVTPITTITSVLSPISSSSSPSPSPSSSTASSPSLSLTAASTLNDCEIPLSPLSTISTQSQSSLLVSLDYIPTTIYSDQSIKLEKPWIQEDNKSNIINENDNNIITASISDCDNNNNNSTPASPAIKVPQIQTTDTSLFLQQYQNHYQFYPSPLPSPQQESSILASPAFSTTPSPSSSTTLSGIIYPPSPCPSIEQNFQNFTIKQEVHILPPSPPESNGAPSPAACCNDIKSEPEIISDTSSEVPLIGFNTLWEKSINSPFENQQQNLITVVPSSSSIHQQQQQQQQQQKQPEQNKKPTQDHQLLREYLQDTSFQKKHNLKPLALESLIGGLGVRGDIEPVISLALEYAKRDAQATCALLKISPDPQQWTTNQVHAWIRSTIKQFKLPQINDIEMKFPENGTELMHLSEDEFNRRVPEAGGTIHAQLEIWKLACTENFSCDLGHQQGTTSNLLWNTTECSQNMNISDDEDEEMRPLPISSVAVAVTPSSSSSSSCMLSNNLNDGNTLLSLCNMQSSSSSSTSSSSSSSHMPSSVPNSGGSLNNTTTMTTGMNNVNGLLSRPASTTMSITPSGVSATPTASSSATSTTATTTPAPAVTTSATIQKTGARPGGSHIHLWQFLKELLSTPQIHGTAIRWLDRNKGVFKIEDSVRVAKLWGRRKNRPAMNYDKLSRSIRQYYKKGIMKKTERSQRLVYQFCHPYSL